MKRSMIITAAIFCAILMTYMKSDVYANYYVTASSSVIDKTQYKKPKNSRKKGEQLRASLISVTPDGTITVQKGEAVRFTCVANSAAAAVKLVNDSNPSDTVVVTKYTLRGKNRVFDINWTPKSAGASGVKICAGNGSTYSDAYKEVQVSVVTANTANISDVYTDKNRIKSGDNVLVTVITNSAVSKVWLNVPREGNILHTTSYTTQGNSRVWEIKWKPQSTGTKPCQAVASDNKGNRDSFSFNIDVL